MPNPTNKIAIVTGASGGIGAAVAERLAKGGFTVIVNYAGNVASAEALVAKIEAAGGRAVTAQADVTDAAAVARMFDTAGGGQRRRSSPRRLRLLFRRRRAAVDGRSLRMESPPP